MSFAIPMVWTEGKDHNTDNYFCMINLKGINRKNKNHVQYNDVPSAIRPIPHGPDLFVPEPDGNIEYGSDSDNSDMTVVAGDDANKPEEGDQLVILTQAELNDSTRDLNLLKESTLLLGSRLKEKRQLAPGTTFYWYRHPEREFKEFFTFQDKSSLVCCRIDQINRLRI